MATAQPIPLTPQEPSSTRLIVSMAVAGFLSGLIIIAIYLVTFDTIKANKARELKAAVLQVLPGVTRMQALHLDNGQMSAWSADPDDMTIYAGYSNSGAFIGYALGGAGAGFQDTVRILYGYRPQLEQVVGMAVLESRETPGLGDKIYKDAAFVANFDALSIRPTIVTVKKGTKQGANEVDAITGATISSKAVVRIINQSLQQWLPHLPTEGQLLGIFPPQGDPSAAESGVVKEERS